MTNQGVSKFGTQWHDYYFFIKGRLSITADKIYKLRFKSCTSL